MIITMRLNVLMRTFSHKTGCDFKIRGGNKYVFVCMHVCMYVGIYAFMYLHA